jgi:peptidoglycan/xylan/chitin deacetylase (PgdA/CDA1 family)
VEAIEPSSDRAPIDSPIVVRFSQPMKRATVQQSFSIQPQVGGTFQWLDDFEMRFRPVRLTRGQLYGVEVGGRSSRGVPLATKESWHFTTVAGPPIVLLPGPTQIRVPILMYHYIRVNPDSTDRLGFALSVTPSDFAAQMDWLTRNGYHPITFEDLNRYLKGERGLPARPVILTFDDGYADFYTTALPILRAHDFSAVAYIVSGFIGWPGYMTADQVVAADRAGIEIGSHTVDHVNLAKQSAGGLAYQLQASKAALEHLLGHPVDGLCYPSGQFSPRVMAAAQAAGYQDATTTRYGSARTLADRFGWGRLRVPGGEGLDQFAGAVFGAS